MTVTRAVEDPDGGARFELGQCVTSPGAGDLIQRGVIYPALLLRRHVMEANDTALATGERLVSVYGRVWVITEANRSVTTILLPEEA
ncbi:MAG: hypothetical protein ACRDRU_17600 [Pseudonocardiaceae bacterium]